jgi:membrane-associated phospholipid phosphatase
MADSVSSGSVVTEDRAARFWLVFGSATAVLFVLTAVVVSPSGGIAQFDQDVMASMSALRHPVLTTVVQFITDLGSYRPVTLLSIMLALVVGFRTRRLLEPVVLLAAVEASSSLVEVLKTVTDRARPPLEGMSGAPVFDYSFPSGHTASGTVLYVLGALLFARTEARSSTRRLLVAAGCVVGGLIGLSRVYLGYHWLTDVVGAWLLALILTSIGMAFVTANRRSESDIVLRNAVAPRDAFSRLTVSSPVADRTRQLVSRWSVNGRGSSMTSASGH